MLSPTGAERRHHLHGHERHPGSAACLPGEGDQRRRAQQAVQLCQRDPVGLERDGRGQWKNPQYMRRARCSRSRRRKRGPTGAVISTRPGDDRLRDPLSPWGGSPWDGTITAVPHAGRDRPLHRVHLALDLRQHPQFPGDFPARGLPHKQNRRCGEEAGRTAPRAG